MPGCAGLAYSSAATHIPPMFARLFKSAPKDKDERIARVPDGTRVYAIGDIHGRLDLLRALHDMILSDAAAVDAERRVVVYLGDIIDRGDHSREVIDLLLDQPLEGFEAIHLMGNHEDFALRFLEDTGVALSWFANGGDATLYSYGVGRGGGSLVGQDVDALQAQFLRALPKTHRAFLRGLAPYHVEGDYLFVHAGIRPGVSIEEQTPDDLYWIRDEFLTADEDFGKVVIHGHTITEEADVQENRIGIDTGAYITGRLTAIVLDGAERRFLQT